MPELAPIETRPPQGSCPSAEDLACYVDGTLSPEEAARVTAHLASCESCFEVYSEVLQFQLESEPAPAGKVVPFYSERRKREPLWYSSIAALLAVGLAGVYFYFLASPPVLATSELTAPFQGKAGVSKQGWMPATRGAEDEDRLMREAAFRLGVQAVNLRTSLTAGDRDTASNVIAFILKALHGQPVDKEIGESFTSIKNALEGNPPAKFATDADRLLEDARELDPAYFDLGRWVEAGRLAAIARDPAFFQQPENRSFLRHVLWRDRFGIKDSKLPEKSRGELRAIDDILDKSELQSADYDTLKSHFDKILDANYPQ